MAKAQSEATGHIQAERYQVEFVEFTAGTDASSLATLQKAVNKGARQSLRLVGVAQEPMSQGVLVVWDTSVSSPGPSRGKRS
jgi:hypothetical protein